jgi:hypothetical protein
MMWVQGLSLAYFQKLTNSMPNCIKVLNAAKDQKMKF